MSGNDKEKDNFDDAPPQRRAVRSRTLKPLNEVLNGVVVKLGLDQRLRDNTLMNLWPVIAGCPWDKKSRALFIDSQRNLVVSVCDAPSGQELSLLKPQMLKKLKAAASTLSMDISGLRLDLKQFHARVPSTIELPVRQESEHLPTNEELSAICLNDEEQAQIDNLSRQLELQRAKDENGAFGGVSSERIVKTFETEIRLRHWRKLNNFPVCRRCGVPSQLVQGAAGLCPCCHLDGGGTCDPFKASC